MKIGIFFLTYKPNPCLLNFLPKLKSSNYDIYLVIDDNSQKYLKIKNIEILQIEDSVCINSGYYNTFYDVPLTNLTAEQSKCTAIDKAFYYFCLNSDKYDYVWIIEDDVLITSLKSILLLDRKYIGYDLLTSKNEINTNGALDWLWPLAKKNFNLPWASSMMNIFRLSKKYVELIKDYVNKNHRLEFPETFYNTFAIHNNLKLDTPKELSTCLWRKDWNPVDFKRNYFYHPVKNFIKHEEYRNNLLQIGGKNKNKKSKKRRNYKKRKSKFNSLNSLNHL